MNVEKTMIGLEKKHPGEQEYLQAVREVLESIEEVYSDNPILNQRELLNGLLSQTGFSPLKFPGPMMMEQLW